MILKEEYLETKNLKTLTVRESTFAEELYFCKYVKKKDISSQILSFPVFKTGYNGKLKHLDLNDIKKLSTLEKIQILIKNELANKQPELEKDKNEKQIPIINVITFLSQYFSVDPLNFISRYSRRQIRLFLSTIGQMELEKEKAKKPVSEVEQMRKTARELQSNEDWQEFKRKHKEGKRKNKLHYK